MIGWIHQREQRERSNLDQQCFVADGCESTLLDATKSPARDRSPIFVKHRRLRPAACLKKSAPEVHVRNVLRCQDSPLVRSAITTPKARKRSSSVVRTTFATLRSGCAKLKRKSGQDKEDGAAQRSDADNDVTKPSTSTESEPVVCCEKFDVGLILENSSVTSRSNETPDKLPLHEREGAAGRIRTKTASAKNNESSTRKVRAVRKRVTFCE